MCDETNCSGIKISECSFCAKSLCSAHKAMTAAGNAMHVCHKCQLNFTTAFSQFVPRQLAVQHASWVAQGRPPQFASPVDINLWSPTFPTVPALLAGCPVIRCSNGRSWTMIDRDHATSLGSLAQLSPNNAFDAHLISMMWGFGKAGYGPFRTNNHLLTMNAPISLQLAAQLLRSQGIIPAFKEFAPRHSRLRLDGLGSAFSTKDLFFFSDVPNRHRALVFDSIVSKWLAANLGVLINGGTENATEYGRYLYAMYSWAADLGETPEDTEVVLFGWVPNARWSPC